MLVEFKLSPEQLAVAQKIQARAEALAEKIEGECFGMVANCNHPALNHNQNLSIDIDRQVLRYRGERHPMHCDGHIEAIKEIFGTIDIVPIRYETNIPALKWNETLGEALCREGNEGVFGAALRLRKKSRPISGSDNLCLHASGTKLRGEAAKILAAAKLIQAQGLENQCPEARMKYGLQICRLARRYLAELNPFWAVWYRW